MSKDLIEKLGESFIKKQCARCGSKNIVFFYEGVIARDIIIDNDIIAKFKAKEWFLNSKFYLCDKCVKGFAKLIKDFFEELEEVDSDETA